MNKYIKIVALVLTLGLGSGAYAIATTSTDVMPGINREVRESRQTFQEETVKQALQQIREQRESARGETNEVRAQIQSEIQEGREALQEQKRVFREDLRKKLASGLRARITKTLLRLDEVIVRLENINKRIETRITRLESEGLTPVTTKAMVQESKEKSDLAKTSIQNAKMALASAAISATTDTEELRNILKAAEMSVKEAKTATVDAIASLRGLGQPATTTESVTP